MVERRAFMSLITTYPGKRSLPHVTRARAHHQVLGPAPVSVARSRRIVHIRAARGRAHASIALEFARDAMSTAVPTGGATVPGWVDSVHIGSRAYA